MQGKTDLSKYNNSDYQPGSRLKRILWYVVNLLFFKQAWSLSNGLKCALLRMFGAKVGRGVVLKPCINIKYPWFLSIGNHVWIGEEVWIDNLGTVTIGDNVCISQGAMLLSGNHNYKSSGFELIIDKIVLEEGVWIGAKAVVCQGVTGYSHAFLTVGSVAISNLEAYGIYRGNPAQKVKERTISTIES